MPIAEFFAERRRGRVPPPRGGAGRRAAGAGRRRRDRARRRQRALRARPRGARRPRSSSGSRPTPQTAWERIGGRRPLAPTTAGASTRLLAERAADVRVARRRDRARPRGRAAPGARRAAAPCASCPPGTRMVVGASASGEYPVYVGRGLLRIGRSGRLTGGAFVVTDETVRRRSTASAIEPLAGAVEVAAGRAGAKTLAEAERVLRELAALGVTRSDHVAALGGGVVGDLAGFCAAIYQRGCRGAGADDAGRPGRLRATAARPASTCRRRRTTSAPTTCRPRCSPTRRRSRTLPREELAAGLRRGAEDGADRRRRALGAGPRARRARPGRARRGRLRLRADEARAWSPPTSATPARAPALNLGHTVGHAIEAAPRLRALPPRRGGRRSGCSPRCELSDAPELRAEVEAMLARHGLPTRLRSVDRRRRRARGHRSRQEAHRRRASGSCSARAPGRGRDRGAGRPG